MILVGFWRSKHIGNDYCIVCLKKPPRNLKKNSTAHTMLMSLGRILVYRCQNHQAPAYLSACITPYVPGRSLRSADHGLLTEHRYRLERYGRRCFSVAGPALWNELPTPVKECQSLPSFKAKLKTHLFRQAFRDLV